MAVKERIDRLMVSRGLAATRSKAQALFSTEGVRVFSGQTQVLRPGALVDPDLSLRVEGQECPFVSRGGLKLSGALDHFGVSVAGVDALDVGASTGGFTDCLLQRGARSVVALDVGIGQLAPKLRADPRVTVREKVNARFLTEADVPHLVDLVVADVSFISLKLVLPSALTFLKPSGAILVLVKPQFEVGRQAIGKHGVVKDEKVRRQAIEGIAQFVSDSGLQVVGWMDSPVPGQEGNLEALLYAKKRAPSC